MNPEHQITNAPLRDVCCIIGYENVKKLHDRGLIVVSRKDFYTLIGDEKAAAASIEYRESHWGQPFAADSPTTQILKLDARRYQRRLAARRKRLEKHTRSR